MSFWNWWYMQLSEPRWSPHDLLGLTTLLRQRRQWHPTPVLLPEKSHGRRSLLGCSPWGRKESDTTERLHFHALKKELATHSIVLAWRIPGMGKPGGLLSMGLHRVGHNWSNLAATLLRGNIHPQLLTTDIDLPMFVYFLYRIDLYVSGCLCLNLCLL